MRIDWKWLLIGYLVGSFFGVSQLLSIFGGVTGAVTGRPSATA
jgi:hypothetical protein